MRAMISVNEGFDKEFYRKDNITEEVSAMHWVAGL